VLIECGAKHSKYEYSELAKFVFGDAGEIIVDVAITLGNFGANLSYVVIIGGSFSEMLFAWGCTNKVGCGFYLWIVLFTLFFVFPLCIKKYFGHLTFISTVSMASICIIVMLVLVGGPIIATNTKGANFGSQSGFASKMGSIVFAFSCAFAALPTFKSLENKTIDNWMTVSRLTVLCGFVLLFIVGLVGSLSFGSNTNGYILDNFHGGYSYIFKLIVIFHLVLYIPVEFLVMRSSLIKLFGQKSGQLENYNYHLGMTLGLLSLLILIASLVRASGKGTGDSFGLFLDLTGGITGSITSFILPGALYLKSMPVTAKYYSVSALMVIFGLIILILVPLFCTK
jgi:sodium-coupled neutral amino acid transporter 11